MSMLGRATRFHWYVFSEHVAASVILIDMQQSFEYGWVKSQNSPELRLWIFAILRQTLTLAAFRQRGRDMPVELVAALFKAFMEDVEAGEIPWCSGCSSEAKHS